MPKTVKEVMCHMNKYAWNNVETEKKGLELGEQQWDETQQQIARALQARWTGAVNKGLNNKGLREIILTTGKGNKHTSNTNELLVKLTVIRWKHARERIDLQEAYGWTGQQSSSGFSDLAPSILHYNWF
jgi:hypothetical protein